MLLAPFHANHGRSRALLALLPVLLLAPGGAPGQQVAIVDASLVALRGYEAPPLPPPATPLSPRPPAPSRLDTPYDDYGVLLHSGEFVHVAVDLSIPGRGLDFAWTRTYRSRSGPGGAQGNGWEHGYEIRAALEGEHVRVYDGNGRSALYLHRPDGSYTAKQFFREGELSIDATFTLSFADMGSWVFRPFDGSPAQGRIDSIVDRNGNALRFLYDAQGRLSQILEALGRTILVAYDGSGRIASVTDFTGRAVTYSYYQSGDADGAAGDLRSMTTPAVTGTPNGNDFPAGKTTTYTYSKGFADERLNHNLLTITDPKGQTWLTNGYASTTNPRLLAFDRIQRQVRGDPGDIVDFVYVSLVPKQVSDPSPAVLRAIVNDRVGNVGEYFYDGRNRCIARREFTGRADPDEPTTATSNRPVNQLRPDDPPWYETKAEFNEDSLVTRMIHANGNVTERVYELALNQDAPWRSRGNLRTLRRLPGSHAPIGDQLEIVETFEYEDGFGTCCGANFVKRHVDARGEETLATFDSLGNRIHVQHRIPTIVEDYEYDSYGRLIAHVRPDNGNGYRRRDEFGYYGPSDGVQNGYLREKIVDAPGFALTSTYEYDAVGNVVREIDPRGHDTLYSVNALNQVVRETSREVVDGSGIRYETDYSYDANDNLVRIDVQNKDGDGNLQSNTHLTTTYEHEILNQVVREAREVGDGHDAVVEYAYDANRNRTLVRYGEAVNGNDPLETVATSYDERDLRFRVARAPGGNGQSTAQYDYDPNGNLRALRDGLEGAPHDTVHEYDAYDRRLQTVDPMGNVEDRHYDPNGNLGGDGETGVPNPFGLLVSGELVDVPGSAGNVRLSEANYAYDAMDRLVRLVEQHFDTQTQLPIGDGESLIQIAYSDDSQKTQLVDDGGHGLTMAYDGASRLLVETDAKGNSRSYGYDANSNVVSLIEVDRSDLGAGDGTFVMTYSYDNLDRPARRVDDLGHVWTMAYDSRGDRVRETDARGNVTRYEYDGLSRLVRTVHEMTDTGDGSGTFVDEIAIAQAWDDSSRLTARTDDNGNTTVYAYDSLDRRVQIVHADCTQQTTSYDLHDRAASQTDANGTRVDSLYDDLDRLIGRDIVPAGGVSSDTTFEEYQYDGLSRIVSAEDDDSLVIRAWDSLSNLAAEGQRLLPGGALRTVLSTWNGDRLRTQVIYPDGRRLVTAYDALHRPSVVSDFPATLVARYDYVGSSRVERREHGNGTRIDYVYDGDRRPINSRLSAVPSGNTLAELFYVRDELNNKLAEDRSVAPPASMRRYEYDSLDRLVRSDDLAGTSIDYQLDGASNRRFVLGGPDQGPYSLNPALCSPGDFQMNQYTATPYDARTYDGNGNLVRTTPPLRDYQYDFNNRLVRVVGAGTGLPASYRYDCFDRRIQRQTAGIVTNHLYDGLQEIEERNAGGAVLATYVWDRSLVQMRRSGQDTYASANDQGGTIVVTNQHGAIVESYAYGDYGKPSFFDALGQPLNSSAIGNPFLYAGLRYDGETGYHCGGAHVIDGRAGVLASWNGEEPWSEWLGNAHEFESTNAASSLTIAQDAAACQDCPDLKLDIPAMGGVKCVKKGTPCPKAEDVPMEEILRFGTASDKLLKELKAMREKCSQKCDPPKDADPKPREGFGWLCNLEIVKTGKTKVEKVQGIGMGLDALRSQCGGGGNHDDTFLAQGPADRARKGEMPPDTKGTVPCLYTVKDVQAKCLCWWIGEPKKK